MSEASTYTTSQGQAWDQIAFDLWGSEAMTHHLLAANPEHRGTIIFSANVKLIIPDVSVPPIEEPPPWQQR